MSGDGSPQMTARLRDGPLAGTTVSVAAVEGRPPTTIDLPGTAPAALSRYCLDTWEQQGHDAVYVGGAGRD